MSTTTDPKVTKEQVMAMFEAVKAVADLIRAKGEVPNGHLYAELMGALSLHQYERIVGVLVGAGLVRQRNHLLTWVGDDVVQADKPSGKGPHCTKEENGL